MTICKFPSCKIKTYEGHTYCYEHQNWANYLNWLRKRLKRYENNGMEKKE